VDGSFDVGKECLGMDAFEIQFENESSDKTDENLAPFNHFAEPSLELRQPLMKKICDRGALNSNHQTNLVKSSRMEANFQSLIAKQMREHQKVAASFILNCLNGKTLKSKNKSFGDYVDDDFVVDQSKVDRKSKLFYGSILGILTYMVSNL